MSKCWYCNEELTTANYCDEHIGICTKCYGSMFKVGNDFVKSLTDKISDLAVKLVEKEIETKSLSDEISSLEQDLTHYKGEVFNLKDQIAKKVAEIEDVKNWWSYQYEGEKQRHNQDKISFCIEQIKNLKLLILNSWRENDCNLILGDVGELIDNQIEELKKEMK